MNIINVVAYIHSEIAEKSSKFGKKPDIKHNNKNILIITISVISVP